MPRTRFVCVSDTHGYAPSEAGFKLPPGDVLIHAGDLTNQGSMAEIRRTMDWISKAQFEAKIIVAGNHDVILDTSLCSDGQNSADGQKYLEAVASESPSIIPLTHESTVVCLTSPEGPRTAFKVFGSPYSPRMSKTWAAFVYEAAGGEDHATSLWSQIPQDTDIVVTHTPPHSHLDTRSGDATGCKALNQALKLVRPCLAVCGHVHESRGVERVKWGITPSEEAESDHVERCDLPSPGSKKQSHVDLTGRRGRRLDNNSVGSYLSLHASSDGSAMASTGQSKSSRRSETCIVNASVMASSWPHRGGKRFNAPIVVDLELPEASTRNFPSYNGLG